MRLPLLNGEAKDRVKKVQKIEKQEIRRFSIGAKRVKSAGEVCNSLSALSFPRISWADRKRTLVCEIVESEDLQKNPYLFTRLEFKPEQLDVTYSVTPEVNGKKREIDVCRLLLNVLALSNAYEAGVGALYERTAKALESSVEFATSDFETMKNRHDELAEECERLRKKCAELALVNEKQSKLLLESEKRAEAFGERAARLESMSDDALMEELYSWIASHSGEMNASEFARVHEVSSVRVDEGLDKLLKGGFIARDAE